jgi:hypothetical protein
MRRHRPSLQLESLESKTLLSGVKPALAPAAHVAVLPREIPSAKHLPISISVSPGSSPGFIGPAAGAPRYRHFAPTEVDPNSPLINQQLGQANAEKIAASLGLKPKLVFSKIQYRKFTTGSGKGGNMIAATIFNDSVTVLTNSCANPQSVNLNGNPTQVALGSYGLTVLPTGMLASDANSGSPSKIVNQYLGPKSYLTTWCHDNHATKSLIALRQSAYIHQILFGNEAQKKANAAQLALYQNGPNSAVVGLSMTPALWEINFCLIYTLKPSLTYSMPAYWTPIPGQVVAALQLSTKLNFGPGQVPFDRFATFLNYKC